jgi:hypothetical protein
MRLDNLDPWPEGVPLIELRSRGSTFDLHNWGELAGFCLVTQAPDFEPRVVGDLDHWLWQDGGGNQGRVEFRFGDLVLEFRAQAVAVE